MSQRVFNNFLVNGVAYYQNPLTLILDGDAVVEAVYNYVSALFMSAPSTPQTAGSSVRVTFTFTNTGGDTDVTFTLKDQTGATLGTTILPVAGNTSNNAGLIDFTMPNADTTLTLTHNKGSSYATGALTLLARVATTLTLTLNSTTLLKGVPMGFSGRLTRADGGVVGVQTVVVGLSSGVTLTTVQTASDGAYSGTVLFASTGNYTIGAMFEGSGLLAQSLSLTTHSF